MTREEDVITALDKPRALYAIQQRVDPSNKSKAEDQWNAGQRHVIEFTEL